MNTRNIVAPECTFPVKRFTLQTSEIKELIYVGECLLEDFFHLYNYDIYPVT